MHVHVPTRTLLIPSEDPLHIREVIKSSRIIEAPDYNIAVKHTVANTRILRNIGYAAPSPIVAYYNWPGRYKPFEHQKVMAEFATMHYRMFNLSEMGAMKTAANLWAADWLMKEGKVHKCLILAPLAILERTWMSDIFDTLLHRQAVVVHGPRETRMKRLRGPADFYVMNHDGLMNKEMIEFIHTNPDFDLVIVDEGSAFRNHDTDRFRGMQTMLRPDMRVWWNTGTPAPNYPSDVWAQVRLVNANNVPKFFGSFKRETMIQAGKFNWKPKDDAYETAFKAMQPAIRFQKKDVIGLPPVLPPRSWQAPLSKEQTSAFKKMRDEMTASLHSGQQVTAVNAADKLNKLRQILCGAIKDEAGNYIVLPHGGRTQLVFDACEQAAAKVIVIVPFKGILQSLAKEIGTKYSVGVLNGDVGIGQRNKIIYDFKNAPDPHVLLCHPQVMSHGLNLTEADMLVFYAPIFSNDQYQQVIERYNRAGQVNPMSQVRIGAHQLEWEIYKTLDERGMSQDKILTLYRQIATGEVRA